MKKWLTVSLLLLLGSGCGKSPQEKMLHLFQTGVEQADRYEFEAALETFDKIGRIDASTPLGYFGTGLVFERRLQVYDALHVYMSITHDSPSFAPAYAGEWRLFTHLEQWDDGVRAAAEYSRLLPDDPEAKLLLADALANIGQYGRARQEVDSAVEMGADPAIAALAQARAYCLDNHIDSAEASYEKAVAMSPESSAFYSLAAAYLESAGLVDSALSVGRQYVASGGSDFDVLTAHFYRALRHNYFYAARQVIRRLKDVGAEGPLTIGLEMFYNLETNQLFLAKHSCSTYELELPMTMSALTYGVLVKGRNEDMMFSIGNIAAIGRIMDVDNYDADFQEYMIFLLAALFAGYFDDLDGLKQLGFVSPAFSNRREVRLKTAYCLYRTGQHEEYEKLMALLSKFHSTQPDWLSGLADIYGDRFVRQYDSAGHYYRTALEQDQWYRPAFENAVHMYRRLGQQKKALGLFDDYSYFERRYPEIALLKALCLVEQGDDIASGVDLFESQFVHVKGDLTTFKEMTLLLEKKDHLQEREKLYRLLTEIGGDNADALLAAAEFELERDAYDVALELAERALLLEPGEATASARRARALYGLGHRSEAFEIFEKNVLEADFNVANNYYFSRILATEQMDLARAANIARRAVLDSGYDVKVWMNLCYVYFQMGRYDLSRGEALKASHTYADEPEPFFRVGMAMFMEKKEEAREYLEKAVGLGLRGEYLEMARQTLKKL